MKNRMLGSLILLLCIASFAAVPARGQSHNAALSWTLSTDDTSAACSATGATCSQTVYRAPGACSASSVFVSLGSPAATATTFTDTTITPGQWCYAVAFVENGNQSVKDTVTVTLQPAPPSGLAVVAN
jgi:hypothetical protein